MKMQKYTIDDFRKDFPNDDVCLEWLKNYLYPNGIFCKKCNLVTKHHRVISRKSYSCDNCGHHVHPTADTIYHKSPTPLHLWFYATYLMASTRCGISAKQIERETGVTYKTAWRMFNKIRSLLDETNSDPLSGQVEVDETYIGGKRPGRRGRGAEHKSVVVGAVERKGRVQAVKVDNVKSETVVPFVKERVLPSAVVFTDELASYNPLRKNGYQHRRIHHASGVYVMADIHTNTIEGFWSLVKRGLSGVYHSVSAKYLQDYLNEFSFRYNHRDDEQPMFQMFLRRIEKQELIPSPAE